MTNVGSFVHECSLHAAGTLSLQESMFRMALLSFINRFSQLLMGSPGIAISDMNVTDVASYNNMTVVDVYIISPATNGESNHQSWKKILLSYTHIVSHFSEW